MGVSTYSRAAGSGGQWRTSGFTGTPAMLSAATLETTLARAGDAALVVDESGTILYANDPACHLLNYGPGELHGQRVELLIPERFRLSHIGHRLRFIDVRRARPMGAGLVLFALCKDGSERRVNVSLNPVQRGLETLTIAIIRVFESDSARDPRCAGRAASDPQRQRRG